MPKKYDSALHNSGVYPHEKSYPRFRHTPIIYSMVTYGYPAIYSIEPPGLPSRNRVHGVLNRRVYLLLIQWEGIIVVGIHQYSIHIPLIFHSYAVQIPFTLHSYSIHISFIFRSYSIHIPLIFHSYSIRIPFIFHSYSIRIPLTLHS